MAVSKVEINNGSIESIYQQAQSKGLFKTPESGISPIINYIGTAIYKNEATNKIKIARLYNDHYDNSYSYEPGYSFP